MKITYALLFICFVLPLTGCNSTPSSVLNATVSKYCAQDEATRVLIIRESINSQIEDGRIEIVCSGDILGK